MTWWKRGPAAEQVASVYAKALFETLRATAQTKTVPPRGMLQILGTLQARLAAGHATALAPKATAALMGSLAELLAALNAGLADYEQSYLGRLDASILRATAGIDEPAQPEQAQSGAN